MLRSNGTPGAVQVLSRDDDLRQVLLYPDKKAGLALSDKLQQIAVETNIEIDYQLSQAGRGLKYSSDPTLLIREPAGMEGEMIRGGGNALVVSEKGDARLLEIGGTASAAVIEYVRTLREMALEGVHGNRASPDRLSAAQSGRAIEMMNQGLVWLADNLRVSYGDAVLKLARMVASHLAVTGGLALSDNLIQHVVGKGLLGRLSARFGEGAVNGILTSRIGLAAAAGLAGLRRALAMAPADVVAEITDSGLRGRGGAALDRKSVV